MRIRPSAPPFALLEIEGFDDLLAGDLAHLGQHAADGPALQFGDRWPRSRASRLPRHRQIQRQPVGLWRHFRPPLPGGSAAPAGRGAPAAAGRTGALLAGMPPAVGGAGAETVGALIGVMFGFVPRAGSLVRGMRTLRILGEAPAMLVGGMVRDISCDLTVYAKRSDAAARARRCNRQRPESISESDLLPHRGLHAGAVGGNRRLPFGLALLPPRLRCRRAASAWQACRPRPPPPARGNLPSYPP